MATDTFFESQSISSKIKAGIVSEYFPSYCKIIVKKHMPKAIRYIDLFAGPGVYEDGNPSTPILIGEACKSDSALKEKVKLVFNDNLYSDKLKENFLARFPDGTFTFQPHFGNSTVGESTAITNYLLKDTCKDGYNEEPGLLFIDPFGYKGIDTKILTGFLKYWGNEIFIFVNTKRIHPALENDKFESLMRELFPTTYEVIKKDRRFMNSVASRLSLIIDSLGNEYNKILNSKVYYTAFKFQEEDSDSTSHYILHLTKGDRGFDLIKTIYNDFANVGTVFDGVNTYTFDAKKYKTEVNELFDLREVNIDILCGELIKNFTQQEISVLELYNKHQTTGLYSRNHYTSALRKLESEGKIDAKFIDGKSHKFKVLMSNESIVTFK